MKFRSTRDNELTTSFSEALLQGLASDGGLFVPQQFPNYQLNDFMELGSLSEIAFRFLQPFFCDDQLEVHLHSICENSFTFETPLNYIDNNNAILELFHGPTGAFKDVGARFLAQCFGKMDGELTILVATSGDTGSAVGAAFHQVPGVKVYILYPKGMISDFQETQLTCWGDNITSLRVDSDFDACQKLVKEAFSDEQFKSKHNLTSANSINIGRLLPQCVYYVYSSISYYKQHQKSATFVIPTGNMGNSIAAIWVKEMGFPIEKIVLACNENDTIVDYIQTNEFSPKPSIRTLANAMDVGNPSNLERFIDLKLKSDHRIDYITAKSVSDNEIRSAIKKVHEEFNQIICPHTATAFDCMRNFDVKDCIIVSTAHPSKFKEVVEPIIKGEVSIPSNLGKFIGKSKTYIDLKADLKGIMALLDNNK
ncbi:MAG: threonine synthase [Candidatus Heimdallarchaeota archaeon]|nr:threonine synthase [Candidatus Heimdallarchaeota archaeon]